MIEFKKLRKEKSTMMTVGEVIEILMKVFEMIAEIFGGLFGSAEGDTETEEPSGEENA